MSQETTRDAILGMAMSVVAQVPEYDKNRVIAYFDAQGTQAHAAVALMALLCNKQAVVAGVEPPFRVNTQPFVDELGLGPYDPESFLEQVIVAEGVAMALVVTSTTPLLGVSLTKNL